MWFVFSSTVIDSPGDIQLGEINCSKNYKSLSTNPRGVFRIPHCDYRSQLKRARAGTIVEQSFTREGILQKGQTHLKPSNIHKGLTFSTDRQS